MISPSDAATPPAWWMAYPVCFVIVGAILAFNVKGAADYLYLRIEGRVTGLGGGIGPRTLRVFGAFFFGMGGIAVTVEIVTRL